MTVTPSEERVDDDEIERQVRAALQRNTQIDADRLDVDVQDGRLP